MPAYSFEALDPQGQTRRGVLEADTARTARSQLRAQDLVPLKVAPVQRSNQGLDTVIWERKVFSTTELGVWTSQLSGLVSAGLPIERALASLSDEAETPRQRDVVAMLRTEVNAGSTFAKALSQHPREFSTIFTAVIGAGEHCHWQHRIHTGMGRTCDASALPVATDTAGTAVANLNRSYTVNGIARARTAAQAKGGVGEVTALDAEKAAFEKGSGVPEEDAEGTPESLKALRDTYRSAFAKITAERDAKAAPLYDLYLKAVDAHIAEHDALGRRDIGVARPSDLVDRTDRFRAVGKRGHRLRPADPVNRIHSGNPRRQQHQRIAGKGHLKQEQRRREGGQRERQRRRHVDGQRRRTGLIGGMDRHDTAHQAENQEAQAGAVTHRGHGPILFERVAQRDKKTARSLHSTRLGE